MLLHEHHNAEDGYSPSPIVFGAAVAGRTKNVGINIAAIILPLHNPIRLAEDLAVLDLVSRGRAGWVFAVGYRREEYEMMGIDIDRRGRAHGVRHRDAEAGVDGRGVRVQRRRRRA